MSHNLLERITVNPKKCCGRPCIRGMRIRVIDVLELFAAGLSAEQILEEMPDLEMEDLQASLQYEKLCKDLRYDVIIEERKKEPTISLEDYLAHLPRKILINEKEMATRLSVAIFV